VVATQWRIADRSTVTLIRAFYEALARGLPVSDALRAAKLDVIRRGAPPKEWAAFITVGDPMVRVALRRPWPEGWEWPVLAATVALAAAGLVYSFRRRRRVTRGQRT